MQVSTFMGCGWVTAEAQVDNSWGQLSSGFNQKPLSCCPAVLIFQAFYSIVLAMGLSALMRKWREKQLEDQSIISQRCWIRQSPRGPVLMSLDVGQICMCAFDSIVHPSICMHAYCIHTLVHEFTLPFTTILQFLFQSFYPLRMCKCWLQTSQNSITRLDPQLKLQRKKENSLRSCSGCRYFRASLKPHVSDGNCSLTIPAAPSANQKGSGWNQITQQDRDSSKSVQWNLLREASLTAESDPRQVHHVGNDTSLQGHSAPQMELLPLPAWIQDTNPLPITRHRS